MTASTVDADLNARIMRETLLRTLALYVKEWDAAVASGSIDAQLAVGRKLRDAADELSKLSA